MSAGPPRPVDEPPAHYVGGRNLPVAIGVGVVLGAVLISAIFWHPGAMLALIGGLIAAAVVESGRTLEGHDQRLDVPLLLVGCLTIIGGAYVAGVNGMMFGLVVLFLGTVMLPLVDGDRFSLVRRLGRNVFFGMWVAFNASFAVLLVADDNIVASAGALLVIGSAVFTDVFAFACGVAFGSRAVAPRVSPNKTWEGLIGGVILTSALAAFVIPMISDVYAPVTAAVVAAACGTAGFFGDLVESMVKRDLGIKDFGAILPGHGGILDRVDGILLALPVGYYLLLFLL